MDFFVFQNTINKIEGVINSKIVSEHDEIKEIHILANNLRSPKQIVRDIESSLLASFDYRVDRKVISIAQIETDEMKTFRRIKFNGITFNTSGNVAECRVSLGYEGDEYVDAQSGIRTLANKRKLVADATIRAVEKILGQAYLFDVRDVVEFTSKDITVVSVIVNILVNETEDAMVGSAIVKDDINESIAKATLDAVNRRVQRNTF